MEAGGRVDKLAVVRWAAEVRVPSLVTLGGHRRFERDQIVELLERMSEG